MVKPHVCAMFELFWKKLHYKLNGSSIYFTGGMNISSFHLSFMCLKNFFLRILFVNSKIGKNKIEQDLKNKVGVEFFLSHNLHSSIFSDVIFAMY